MLRFGFSYKVVSAEATSFPSIPDPLPAKIRMSLLITLSDGSTESKEINQAIFSPTDKWQDMREEYVSDKTIVSAQIQIGLLGKAEVYIDDVYLCRDFSQLRGSDGAIASLAADKNVLLAPYSRVTLSADLSVAVGRHASTHWFDNLEGSLGEGQTIYAILSTPGAHTILCRMKDDFGQDVDNKTINIEVVKPEFSLTSAQVSAPDQAVSGVATFNVIARGLPSGYTFKGSVMANGIREGAAVLDSSHAASFDTTLLPAGFNSFKAKLTVKDTAGYPIGIYLSDALNVVVNNGFASRIPSVLITDSSGNVMPSDSGAVYINELANAQLSRSSRLSRKLTCTYKLIKSGVDYKIGSSSSFPYSVTLNPSKLPKGEFLLYAIVQYSSREIAQSLPERVIIGSSPPRKPVSLNTPQDVSAQVSSSAVLLSWQFSPQGDEIICLEKRAYS